MVNESRKNLYNHRNQHIGQAAINRAEETVIVNFKDNKQYKNKVMKLEDYNEYRNNMGFKYEEEIGQLDIFDF